MCELPVEFCARIRYVGICAEDEGQRSCRALHVGRRTTRAVLGYGAEEHRTLAFGIRERITNFLRCESVCRVRC